MSGNHQIEHNPALTVLQLDTAFPRIPGDVAAPETYLKPITIIPIPHVGVADVVTATPNATDISGFEHAVKDITSGIGVTSCGFLGYWQDHLSRLCPRPFLSSSLIELSGWTTQYQPHEIAIVTFNSSVLRSPFYQNVLFGFGGTIIGLDPDMHLYDVIAHDKSSLDQDRATDEILDLVAPYLQDGTIKVLILECTNLPPYKSAIKSRFGVAVFDILNLIDKHNPNLIDTRFLS